MDPGSSPPYKEGAILSTLLVSSGVNRCSCFLRFLLTAHLLHPSLGNLHPPLPDSPICRSNEHLLCCGWIYPGNLARERPTTGNPTQATGGANVILLKISINFQNEVAGKPRGK